MKTFGWWMLLAAGFSARAQVPAASLAATVSAGKWTQRILLLCAPDTSDVRLRRQRQLLAEARPQLADRDVLVREVISRQLSAADQQYLRVRLQVPPGGFMVVLIGKDGGVKQRATTPLSTARLFATIDAMPMRQREMRPPK